MRAAASAAPLRSTHEQAPVRTPGPCRTTELAAAGLLRTITNPCSRASVSWCRGMLFVGGSSAAAAWEDQGRGISEATSREASTPRNPARVREAGDRACPRARSARARASHPHPQPLQQLLVMGCLRGEDGVSDSCQANDTPHIGTGGETACASDVVHTARRQRFPKLSGCAPRASHQRQPRRLLVRKAAL